MKQIVCEMCGGTDLIKEEGLFVCQSCGVKYSLEEAKKLLVEGTVKIDKTDEVQSLLKRAFMHLEESKWKEADALLEQILNQNPQNAQAYVGKLMVQLRVQKQEQIGELPILFDDNIHYKRIMQFGSKELKETFLRYNQKANPVGRLDQKGSFGVGLKEGDKRFVVLPNGQQKPRDKSVEEVIFLRGVKHIDDDAFKECKALTNVTIPDTVTSIGKGAFFYCTALTNVTIPNSVTSIGMSAFAGCASLTSITISNSVTSIGDSVFFECTALTSVTIPNSVTSIASFAFVGCTALTNVIIPNSVKRIDEAAFYRCSSLTSVTIPNSVTRIERSVFEKCDALTNITIPVSVTEFGEYPFGFSPTVHIKFEGTAEQWEHRNKRSRMSTYNRVQCSDRPELEIEQMKAYQRRLEREAQEREREEQERQRWELEHQWMKEGLCRHCGGKFKGIFTYKCVSCGKKKDYEPW